MITQYKIIMKGFLEKGYRTLFYATLAVLFLKGEVFRINTPCFSFTFTSVKNLCLLFIACWLIRRIFAGARVHFSPALFLVLLLAILSLIYSAFPLITLSAVSVLFIYTGWFYGMWDILKKPLYRRHLVVLMVTIAGVVSLANIWFHWSLGLDKILEEYPFWRGKNAQGIFLVMSLSLCGGWLSSTKKRLHLWLLIINYLAIMTGVALSYSRGAWCAALFSLLCILCFRLRRMAFIILGCAIIILIISPQLVPERFISIFNINETNIKTRVSLWMNIARVIKEKPIVGTGLGTFTHVYRKYYPDDFPLAGEGSRVIRHAHNLYLQLLLETGIAGFIVFLVILIAGLMRCIKNLLNENDPDLLSIRYGSLVGIVCFLIYSVTDSPVSFRFIGDSFSHANLIWVILWVCALVPNEDGMS